MLQKEFEAASNNGYGIIRLKIKALEEERIRIGEANTCGKAQTQEQKWAPRLTWNNFPAACAKWGSVI